MEKIWREAGTTMRGKTASMAGSGAIGSHLQSRCHPRLDIVLNEIQLQIGIPSKDRTTHLQILGHPSSGRNIGAEKQHNHVVTKLETDLASRRQF